MAHGVLATIDCPTCRLPLHNWDSSVIFCFSFGKLKWLVTYFWFYSTLYTCCYLLSVDFLPNLLELFVVMFHSSDVVVE